MTFKFECPSCGQRISATAGDIGTIGICPACRIEFEVPRAERRGGLALALVALGLGATPWLCWSALRSIRVEISLMQFEVLAGVVTVLCVTGVIVGHRAWRRSVVQRAVRMISGLSLVIAYVSTLVMALVMVGAMTGGIVRYNHYEVPDFEASGTPLEAAEPTPRPAPKEPTQSQ